MTDPELDDIQTIAALLYRRELARLAPVLRDEAQIRAALGHLDTMVAEARGADMTSIALSGGDAVWTTWVERQRTGLQSDLARVLARKVQETAALRTAFGRVRALEDLARLSARSARRTHDRRTAETARALAAFPRNGALTGSGGESWHEPDA